MVLSYFWRGLILPAANRLGSGDQGIFFSLQFNSTRWVSHLEQSVHRLLHLVVYLLMALTGLVSSFDASADGTIPAKFENYFAQDYAFPNTWAINEDLEALCAQLRSDYSPLGSPQPSKVPVWPEVFDTAPSGKYDEAMTQCYMEVFPPFGEITKYTVYYAPVLTSYSCPLNSFRDGDNQKWCKCDGPYTARGNVCIKAPPAAPQMCKAGTRKAGFLVGDPIAPATGDRVENVTDFLDEGPSPLVLRRFYRSGFGSDPSRSDSGFGRAWTLNHGAQIFQGWSSANVEGITIEFPEGHTRSFKAVPAVGWSDPSNPADKLTQTSTNGWTYRRAGDDTTFNFSSGKLQSQVSRNGQSITYTYNSSGQLSSISNSFGRTLTFHYNGDGRIDSVATPDGRAIDYSYDPSKRLTAVTYADGRSIGYLYENASFPHALTGSLDEAGVRYLDFAYDSQGRATSTQMAGNTNQYTVRYDGMNLATVFDPLNTSRWFIYEAVQGKLEVTGSSTTPSGVGESDARSRVRDANGLVTSETDFNDVVTTTAWDVNRQLPTSITRAAGTPEAQTINIEWNANYALPTLLTEAGRSTAYSYDSSGNVLTKVVTDTATNKVQAWGWTYNGQRLVATYTEPNGAVTSYAYDIRGNLLSKTNHLGHLNSYTYDIANRVTSTTAPNGLITSYTYDSRGRLLTQTVGVGLASARTMTFTYKPYGRVATVSLPSGLVLTYAYDGAHRLTGWLNNRGESGSFSLDAMGNRVAEQITDSAGTVAWQLERTINSLNRLSGQTEGPNQTSSFSYDANGELARTTNGLYQSTNYGLDGLRRIKAITDATNATATLKYDALDAVTEAKDFKGVSTGYTRDAQGNATVEGSTDTGGTRTEYDILGLPSKVTDALNQATAIERDKLGRPISLVFADGKTTILRYDLSLASRGYLSEIVDRSGTTTYTRDAFGSVILKKQALANGSAQQVSYGYNSNGTLASIGYPSGGTLLHQYDSTGRLTGLTLNGSPLISNLTWNPLGQPKGWTWAFTNSSPKLAAARTYDTAGRMKATEFSFYVYNAAGRITYMNQDIYAPADNDPSHSTIAIGTVYRAVGYDNLGQITSFNISSGGADTAGFGYDANGNRSSSTTTVNGQSTSRSYNVASNSNRLLSFSQTAGGATTNVTYGYNANGDLASDGLRSYGYDAEGRLSSITIGAADTSPTTRYAHNALGQRVFKTEPLYSPTEGDEADPGFMQSLVVFFTKLWSPSTTPAEQQGYAYVYDEQGTLIAEIGSGGTNSAGQASYIYLPTANGPMPIATVINGTTYAVHSDHLNTPRRLTDASGQAVWQWRYSAFGEEEPTTAAKRFTGPATIPSAGATSATDVVFNLRYPGQYADKESGLFYNYFRSYDSRTGRYSQADPIGLDGGWNRWGYVGGNPLIRADPKGLFSPFYHRFITEQALKALGLDNCKKLERLPSRTMEVDYNIPGSQRPENSYWHAMRDGTAQQSVAQAEALYNDYVATYAGSGTVDGLARALHAVQDSSAAGHQGFQPWNGGFPSGSHFHADFAPEPETVADAINKSIELLKIYGAKCDC